MTTPPTTDAAKLREAANWVLQQDDNGEQDELLARHVLATVPEDAHSWRATTPGEPHEEGAVCNKCGKYATSEGNQLCE